MADRKLVDLTNLGTAPATDDILLIGDVSTSAPNPTNKKVTVANLIDAVEANANTFTGVQTFTSAIVPPSPNTNVYAMDASGNAWEILDTAVLDVASTNVFSGALIITETNSGSTGMFLSGGNVVTMLGQSESTGFSATKNTSSRINVYWESNAVRIQNLKGATVNLYVIALRTRAA